MRRLVKEQVFLQLKDTGLYRDHYGEEAVYPVIVPVSVFEISRKLNIFHFLLLFDVYAETEDELLDTEALVNEAMSAFSIPGFKLLSREFKGSREIGGDTVKHQAIEYEVRIVKN